jgi:hypothetical protein
MICSPTTPSGCNEIIDVADSVMLYPLVSIQSRQNGVSYHYYVLFKYSHIDQLISCSICLTYAIL